MSYVAIIYTIATLLIFSGMASADTIRFDSLGIAGTYSVDSTEFQVDFDVRVSNPSDLVIKLYTYRDASTDVEVYVNNILATTTYISSGNEETTIKIPSAFVKTGKNAITLKFRDNGDNTKFSTCPISLALGSYITSSAALKAGNSRTPKYMSKSAIATPKSTDTPDKSLENSIKSPGFESIFAIVTLTIYPHH